MTETESGLNEEGKEREKLRQDETSDCLKRTQRNGSQSPKNILKVPEISFTAGLWCKTIS